MGIKQLKRYF